MAIGRISVGDEAPNALPTLPKRSGPSAVSKVITAP